MALVETLKRYIQLPVRVEILLGRLDRVQQQLLLAEVRGSARYHEDKRLLKHGFSVHSQTDEDGILAEIFRRIGDGGKRFVEIGIQDGLECNSAFLLVKGWRGAWVEGSDRMAGQARRHFADYPVRVLNAFITAENVDALVTELAEGEELDLLSIDIDYNDYWAWKAVTAKPRVVVIEYNAFYPPPVAVTVPYRPEGVWNGTSWAGASLSALEKLGKDKGYSLVGCSLTGINAFFVRDDLVGDKFRAPFTAENHYEPWREIGINPKRKIGIGPPVRID